MNDENPNESATTQGSTASDLQNRATQDLGQVASQAKTDLDAVTQRAAQDARELGAQAKEKVGEVTEQAKSFAADQKGLAANQINGVASAITKVADELDSSDQGVIARYARDLASGLSSLGKTVEDKDVDDLMGMAQTFGRTQPIAFLGVAALAGFVASRFALASSHRRDTRTTTGTSAGGYTPSGSGSYGQSSGYGSSSQYGNAGSTGSYGSGSGTAGQAGGSSYGSGTQSGQSGNYGSGGSGASTYRPGTSSASTTTFGGDE